MPNKSPEWLNGYKAGRAGFTTFAMPETLTDTAKRGEWMSGFLVGARAFHDDDGLIEEIQRCL